MPRVVIRVGPFFPKRTHSPDRPKRRWLQTHQRAALYALAKSTILIGALWEYVWLWHTKYYSRHVAEVPLSLAWSLLTVIGGITFAQVGCSAVLKARSARLRKAEGDASAQLRSVLADYISGGNRELELQHHALESPAAFESCVTAAMLGTRGAAFDRLRALPSMTVLRDRWIGSLHRRNEQYRRHAVEHLALLRDPAAIMALEFTLDDKSAGVVAASVRGLLRVPGYTGRDALVRSIPGRPYLVRVLTAGESPQPMPAPQDPPMRTHGMEEAVKSRRNDSARINCSVLAASGTEGRDLLHLMSALGTGGDAPAEALGVLLAGAAKGDPMARPVLAGGRA